MRSVSNWRRRQGGSVPPTVPHAELTIDLAGRQVHLVLGLSWHTILGKDLALQARRRARQLGASHWVHAGGRAESVGTLARTASRRLAAAELHAGAQMFARARVQGAHALAWRLVDGRIWLALVREGQVLEGGDRIFDSAADAANALHAAWLRFDGTLQCWAEAGNLLAGVVSGAVQASPAVEPTDLAAGACAATLLQRTPADARRWATWGIMLGLAGAAAWGLRQWGVNPAPPPDNQLDAPPALATVQDLRALWRQHIADAIGRVRVPSVDGLAALWRAVGAFPLRPGGWLLNDVQCASGANEKWECRAGYRRAWRLAGNQALLNALNPGCTLRWDSLDAATAVCGVDVGVRAPDLNLLQTNGQRLLAGADAIQAIRPLIARLEVGAARQVALAAPTDAQGASVPRPAGVATLHERSIQAYGPLRTMALLGPAMAASTAWRGLAVSLQHGAQAGATTSILMATLSGVAYETRP